MVRWSGLALSFLYDTSQKMQSFQAIKALRDSDRPFFSIPILTVKPPMNS